MTLIEAVKSGLPFKREKADNWVYPQVPYGISLLLGDIVATDYVTMPTTIPPLEFKCYWSKDHLNNHVFPIFQDGMEEIRRSFSLLYGKETKVRIEVIE
jgi:hypothetical protein